MSSSESETEQATGEDNFNSELPEEIAGGAEDSSSSCHDPTDSDGNAPIEITEANDDVRAAYLFTIKA